jgi:broad specificity phosphatase PhoE
MQKRITRITSKTALATAHPSSRPTVAVTELAIMSDVTLYLIRHGETDWNVAGRLQGQIDTDLTERGEAQAGLVGGYFTKLKLNKIVSSDLKRCVETAKRIAASASTSGVEIQTDSRLRERHLGVIQGLTHEESRLQQPEAWTALSYGMQPEGGESVKEVENRSAEAIFDIVGSCQGGERVAVISHGGTLHSMQAIFFKDDQSVPGLKNCSISIVSYSPANKTFAVQDWGSIEHLSEVESLSEVDRA